MSHKEALGLHGGVTRLIRTDNPKPAIIPFYDMAPSMFSALPNSPDVARLVQDRLSKVQQQFPACCPSTLSDLRIVSDELSTISKTFATIVEDLETQESETDATTAFKKLEAALDWTKFLQYVQTERSPAEHPFLFRAHHNTTSGDSESYKPSSRNVLFNDQMRQQHTVHAFVKAMATHLGKTQLKQETGTKHNSMFTSMSPILEWTLHTTKNKWAENIAIANANVAKRTCLVIFDIRRMREMQHVAIFRISDVVRYLESQNQMQLIHSQLREWAENCDEYVTMGRAVENAVVRVISWHDLRLMPIINTQFITAYTLAVYRQWRDEREYTLRDREEAGRILVRSVKVLAGHDARNDWMVQPMLKLILKPGVFFWGINTNASRADVMHACEAILEQELVEQLSQTSLG